MDPLNVLAVEPGDDVTGLDPRLLGRAAGLDRGNQRSLGAGYSERLGDRGRDLLKPHSDITTLDPTGADQLIDDTASSAGGHGKADSYAAARRRDDGGVDPDHLATRIKQGPPELPLLIEASVCRKSS